VRIMKFSKLKQKVKYMEQHGYNDKGARREYFNSVGNAVRNSVRNSYRMVPAVLLLGGTLMSGPCDPVAQLLHMPHRGNYDPVELGLFYGTVAVSSLCMAGIMIEPILRDWAMTRDAGREQSQMGRLERIPIKILGREENDRK
jgi:hypothetical protein